MKNQQCVCDDNAGHVGGAGPEQLGGGGRQKVAAHSLLGSCPWGVAGVHEVQWEVVLSHNGRVTCWIHREKVGDNARVVMPPLSHGVL